MPGSYLTKNVWNDIRVASMSLNIIAWMRHNHTHIPAHSRKFAYFHPNTEFGMVITREVIKLVTQLLSIDTNLLTTVIS